MRLRKNEPIVIGRGLGGPAEVLFICFDIETGAGLHPRDKTPPFGLLLSGAILETAGRGSMLLELNHHDLATHRYERYIKNGARVVVVETGAGCGEQLKALAFAASRCGASVIACGPYIATNFESVLDEYEVDFCVAGEAEPVTPALVNWIISDRAGEPPAGVRWIEDGTLKSSVPAEPANTDSMPFLPLTALKSNRYEKNSFPVSTGRRLKWGFVLGNRGCRFSCDFCTAMTRQSLEKKYRLCSPERLYAEMKYQIEEGGRNIISVEDDLFTGSREWTLAFCRLLKQKNWRYPWIMQTRFDCLDEELLIALKRAGCAGITCGVESGSDIVLERLNKKTTVSRIRETGAAIGRLGFTARYTTMTGSPGESEADFEKTAALIKELNPTVVQMSFCTPYPDTKLHVTNRPPHMKRFEAPSADYSAIDPEKLGKLRLAFYKHYYFSFRYIRGHISEWVGYYLHNPLRAMRQVGTFLLFLTGQKIRMKSASSLFLRINENRIDEQTAGYTQA